MNFAKYDLWLYSQLCNCSLSATCFFLFNRYWVLLICALFWIINFSCSNVLSLVILLFGKQLRIKNGNTSETNEIFSMSHKKSIKSQRWVNQGWTGFNFSSSLSDIAKCSFLNELVYLDVFIGGSNCICNLLDLAKMEWIFLSHELLF